MTALHSRQRRTRGQALAEMAVMVPFLVIGMMGFLDLGRAFYYQISLTNAVREGARIAAQNQYFGRDAACNVPPNPSGATCPVPTDATACARVQQELANTGFNVACTDVTVNPNQADRTDCWLGVSGCDQSPSSQYSVKVTGVFRFHFITPIIGSLIGDPLSLTSSAEMRTDY